MTTLRVLTSGVDSLYFSVKGNLYDGLLLFLKDMREMSDDSSEPIPMNFFGNEVDCLLRKYGWRGFPFWISTPECEIFLGAAEPFPPAYVQMHSEYIHSVGLDEAVMRIETMLHKNFFPDGFRTTISRADLFVDEQGWEPSHDDFLRFACRGVVRRLYEVPRQMHNTGRQLSGFTFGKGDLVARIYDKTLQMRIRSITWPKALWFEPNPDRPVWRLEFQFRRGALSQFGTSDISSFYRVKQDLWDHATQWLSLRQPSGHAVRGRWPVSDTWKQIQRVSLGTPKSGMICQYIHEADERRLIQGFVGYATSLEAMGAAHNLEGVVTREIPGTRRYLAERADTFPEIVKSKREKRLTLMRSEGER